MRVTKFHIRTAEAARAIIERSLDKNITPDDIARKLQVSLHLLRKIYNLYYGTGLNSDRLRLRLKRSCELLAAGDENLKIIARKSGYNRVCNFITAFKKVYGITPGSYREL